MGIELKTKFASRVSAEMEAQHMSMKDLAEKCEATYEHLRKIVKGLSYPSPLMVKKIAEALKLDKVELGALAAQDRIKYKHGSEVTAALTGVPPRMMSLVNADPYLTDEDVVELEHIAAMKAKIRRQQSKKLVGAR